MQRTQGGVSKDEEEDERNQAIMLFEER